MDSLDAYMETLDIPKDVYEIERTEDQQMDIKNIFFQSNDKILSTSLNTSISKSVIRNRRYACMHNLLSGDWDGNEPVNFNTHSINSKDLYFSDERMKYRNPALFHFYLGQYLNHNSIESNLPHLASFLLSTYERQELEIRRKNEISTWVKEDPEENQEEDLTIEERRNQLIEMMCERFINGDDYEYINYKTIDYNTAFDDWKQIEQDAQDLYFSTD